MLNFVAKFAITAALTGMQMALGAMRKIEGPRLDSLDVSTADFGSPIPRIWGLRKFEGALIMWAEKLHETKKKSKTKGGKYSEYKYDGTWAVLLCEGEIDAVRRIWLDKHLSYDRTGPGPVSIAQLLKRDTVKLTSNNMRIYLGTETQMPDPRMEAWCEDRYGPDSCPAYRGRAYIVFEQIPLEKFGNRIPQIAVEVVRTKTDLFIYEIVGDAGSGVGGDFSPNGSFMYQEDGPNLFVWDVATRTVINRVTIAGGSISAGPGVLWAIGGGFSPDTKQLWLYDEDGLGGTNVTPSGFEIYTAGLRCVAGTPLFYPVTSNEVYWGIQGTNSEGVPSVVSGGDLAFSATHYFEGPDESAWAVGGDPFTLDNLGIARLLPNQFAPVGYVVTGTDNVAFGMWNGGTGIVVWKAGELFLLDVENPSTVLLGPVAAAFSTAYVGPAFNAVTPGAPSIWLAFTEYSTTTLEVLQTIEPSDWIAQTMTGGHHEPLTDAILTHEFGSDEVTWRYLNRVGNPGVTLGEIVDEVCEWIGVDDAETSLLTQVVEGYSVTQGAAKEMIAPLLDLHDVDARPHNFGIQFLPRGTAAALTIDAAQFVKLDGESRYITSVTQDTDLPDSIVITYADPAHEQQVNVVRSSRELGTSDSSRVQTLDLTTLVMGADSAKPLCDRLFRRTWNERGGVSSALTMQQLALEPGDTRWLTLDGVTWQARLVKMTVQAARIACEWRRDDPSLHDLSLQPGAPMEGREPEIIVIPGPTRGFQLDIPLLEDADNAINPLIYYGAGPYITGGTWPGAGMYESDLDGEDYAEFASIDSSSALTWGFADAALGSADAGLWDRVNSVTLQLKSGTIVSVTEADLLLDAELNLAVVGAELIQFTTATLNVDGTWTLTNLLRGRRGTEWAIAGHADNEAFILAEGLASTQVGVSAVGASTFFKTQTLGRAPESAMAVPFTFTGATLKPYAPAGFIATKDAATGDWVFRWTRRSRIGGPILSGSVIPLGEVSEAYELVIPTSDDDGSRTISASSPTATWSAAQQTADYGAPQATLPAGVAVYQLSDSVGRGFTSAAPALAA